MTGFYIEALYALVAELSTVISLDKALGSRALELLSQLVASLSHLSEESIRLSSLQIFAHFYDHITTDTSAAYEPLWRNLTQTVATLPLELRSAFIKEVTILFPR